MTAKHAPMWVALPPGFLSLDHAAVIEVRDPYGQVLVSKGQIIDDARMLQRIQAIGMCSLDDIEHLDELVSMEASPIKAKSSLDEFHLGIGTLLFLDPSIAGQNDTMPTQLIGILPGEDLLVRPTFRTEQEQLRLKMATGQTLNVRIAVGQDILHFESQLSHICLQPYWYLHLRWPDSVTLQQDRLCPRLPMHQPILIEREGDVRRSALLLNLSEQGALVQYHTRLGKIGERIQLRFVLPAERGHVSLNLSGIIRNKHAGMLSDDVVLHGVEFSPLSSADMQVIRRHVQRHLLAANTP